MYVATTLDEFLKEKGKITATRTYVPIFHFYNGFAAVILQDSMVYKGPDVVKRKPSIKGFIKNPNLIQGLSAILGGFKKVVKMSEKKIVDAKLEDFTTSLNVKVHPSITSHGSLSDGRRLFQIEILYDPSDDLSWLFNYKTEGPKSIEEESFAYSMARAFGKIK